MDFKFCLLAGGRPASCSDCLIIYSRMRDDVIGAIFSNRDLKKANMAPWEIPFHFEFFHLKCSALLADKRPNEVPFNRP